VSLAGGLAVADAAPWNKLQGWECGLRCAGCAGGEFRMGEGGVSGEEPMTGAQRSYLHTLAEEAGEEVPEELTKADASKRIDALREKTGKSG
jgi:DUF3072 family protein